MTTEIRAWCIDDAHALAEILNNKKIHDNLRDGLPYPYTEKDAEEYISAMLSADKNKSFAFAIVCDGKVAGSVSVFRRDNIHRKTGELGYYLGEKYWNKGVTTAAVKAICKLVFENSDIIRIFAEPFARNAPSCRVLEKAGFVCEGVLKCDAVKNGVVEDVKIYALLK